MTVDVDVVIKEKPDALLLPVGAIAHGPSLGGRPGPPFVFVVESERVRRVDVVTGAVGAAKVEIISGLTGDEAVVVDPSDRLGDGETVRASP